MGVVTGGAGRLIDRRVGGALMLVTALLVVLVVPKVLNPPRVDGAASMAPPPPPPAVGDCIDQSFSGSSTSDDGQIVMDRPALVVPCSEPHGSEIVRVGPTLAAADTGSEYGPAGDLLISCWADSYPAWSDGSGDWTPASTMAIGVIGPDRRQSAVGQSWTACTAGVSDGRLDRRLADLSVDGEVPALFGACSNRSDSDPTFYGDATCTEPHNREDIGSQELEAGSILTQSELVRSCTELAVRATGRVDLASDPDLVIATDAYAWFDSDEGAFVTLPLPADAAAGRVSCALHTTGGRMLTTSLRQFGDGPLPFVN